MRLVGVDAGHHEMVSHLRKFASDACIMSLFAFNCKWVKDGLRNDDGDARPTSEEYLPGGDVGFELGELSEMRAIAAAWCCGDVLVELLTPVLDVCISLAESPLASCDRLCCPKPL